MILLAGIQATAQSVRPVIILKGEKAPFEGILLSEDIARKVDADLYAKDEFKDDLQKCLQDQKEVYTPRVSTGLVFSSGIILGLVSGFLLARK